MIFLAKLSTRSRDGILWQSAEQHARWKLFVQDNEGESVRIALPTQERSLSQNSYYWKYLDIISRETGNVPLDLHEYFKRILLPPVHKSIVINGKRTEVRFPASTKDLNTEQFSDYLDKICALTNVPLPERQLVQNV